MTTARTPRLDDHREQPSAADGHGSPAPTTASWRRAAHCAGTDIEIFFPRPGDRVTTQLALATCGLCPVRIPCRRYALSHGERHGVWGGLTEETREMLRRMGPPLTLSIRDSNDPR